MATTSRSADTMGLASALRRRREEAGPAITLARQASIASDDALILPHRANPHGWNFRERQGRSVAISTSSSSRSANHLAKSDLTNMFKRPMEALH